MTADARYWASWFWNRAGGRPQYPANIGYAASCALDAAIMDVGGLTPRTAAARLARLGISLPAAPASDNRPLRGCVSVGPRGAIILIDADDSESERRFTIAHEVAHYILEARAHRDRAERVMGERYLDVLYGARQPTDAERVDALLKRVRSTPLSHFMDRSPDGGHGCGRTLSAECDADALALELLAPRSELSRRVRALRRVPFRRALNETARLAQDRYGLPQSIAREYSERLAWRILGGPSAAERFGFASSAAR